VDALEKSREYARNPRDWFAVSESHEDFWRRVRPIVNELERLRRQYGKQEACVGIGEPACPPHIQCSIRNWRESLERIHCRMFGKSRGVRMPEGMSFLKNVTRLHPPARIPHQRPLPYETHEEEKKAA